MNVGALSLGLWRFDQPVKGQGGTGLAVFRGPVYLSDILAAARDEDLLALAFFFFLWLLRIWMFVGVAIVNLAALAAMRVVNESYSVLRLRVVQSLLVILVVTNNALALLLGLAEMKLHDVFTLLLIPAFSLVALLILLLTLPSEGGRTRASTGHGPRRSSAVQDGSRSGPRQ